MKNTTTGVAPRTITLDLADRMVLQMALHDDEERLRRARATADDADEIRGIEIRLHRVRGMIRRLDDLEDV